MVVLAVTFVFLFVCFFPFFRWRKTFAAVGIVIRFEFCLLLIVIAAEVPSDLLSGTERGGGFSLPPPTCVVLCDK